MHDKHKYTHHKIHPSSLKPERKFDYQFILLNEDKPVGCIKGYSGNDDGEIDEVIVYICGMKNTFHIESNITKHEMEDFLRLAMSPIFTETFFGSKIYMAGFDEGRQLFCSLSNEQKDYVSSTWNDEMRILEESKELEEDFDLDIYPDIHEEDNEKSNVNVIIDDSENNEEDAAVDETGNDTDFVIDQIQLPEKEECIHQPMYQPLVRLYMEDKEYGALLDVDITWFTDAHKPKHHNHHPHKQEYDEDPTDDLYQDEEGMNSDGIDHTIQDMYL